MEKFSSGPLFRLETHMTFHMLKLRRLQGKLEIMYSVGWLLEISSFSPRKEDSSVVYAHNPGWNFGHCPFSQAKNPLCFKGWICWICLCLQVEQRKTKSYSDGPIWKSWSLVINQLKDCNQICILYTNSHLHIPLLKFCALCLDKYGEPWR